MNWRALPGPYAGLGRKILFARQCYRDSFQHSEARAYAEQAIGRGPRRVQAERLFNRIRDDVNYVGDPQPFIKGSTKVGVEFIKAPWVMVNEIRRNDHSGGDCDDQAVLGYTLLKLVGIPAKLRVGWLAGAENPAHIYVAAYLDGAWVPFDTTRAEFGTEHPLARVEDYD